MDDATGVGVLERAGDVRGDLDGALNLQLPAAAASRLCDVARRACSG